MRRPWVVLAGALAMANVGAATHEALIPLMELTAQSVTDEIRPGAWMSSPHHCTMGFVLRDHTGALHILTAGSCVDNVGDAVVVRGVGTIGAAVAVTDLFGTNAALVTIDPELYDRVNPTVVGWGGPTGLEEGSVAQFTMLHHYGWGVGGTWLVDQTRCRVALYGQAASGGVRYLAYGHVLFGDSGSPVTTADGRALGLVDGLFISTAVPPRGTMTGPRLSAMIPELEAMTGLDLALVEGMPAGAACLEA